MLACLVFFCFLNWSSCPQSVWKCLLTLCCAACKCLCSSALDSSGHWTGMVDIQKSERRREIRACIKVHSYTCGSSYIFAFFNVTGLNQMPWGHISALVTYQEFEPFLWIPCWLVKPSTMWAIFRLNSCWGPCTFHLFVSLFLTIKGILWAICKLVQNEYVLSF